PNLWLPTGSECHLTGSCYQLLVCPRLDPNRVGPHLGNKCRQSPLFQIGGERQEGAITAGYQEDGGVGGFLHRPARDDVSHQLKPGTCEGAPYQVLFAAVSQHRRDYRPIANPLARQRAAALHAIDRVDLRRVIAVALDEPGMTALAEGLRLGAAPR